MKFTLMAALAGVSMALTGCGCLDTVFYGNQSCAPHWTGSCGSCAEDYCGDACCGPQGSYAHQCPLIEVLSALHPDNLLCVHEYRERDACGSCGYGCGEKYYGDWYAGERAGCESCDCHGNWVGPSRGYAHRRAHVVPGDEFYEGEIIEGEPTPARPMPPQPMPRPEGANGVRPGPRDDAMPMPGTQSRGRSRSTRAMTAKVTRSRKPVALRPVDADGEWTSQRGR